MLRLVYLRGGRLHPDYRSEERRGGEEGRTPGAPDHLKKKKQRRAVAATFREAAEPLHGARELWEERVSGRIGAGRCAAPRAGDGVAGGARAIDIRSRGRE